MPDTTTHPTTRPAVVHLTALVAGFAALVTVTHGSDVLTILIAGFLLKTLDTWRPR